MATKPTKLPEWATTGGTTSEPSAGQKAAGWTVATRPPARRMNWILNIIYQWCAYVKDAVFVGEAGQPGITATGGSSNGAGGVFTGNGSGNGLTVSTGSGGKALVVTGSGNVPAAEFNAGSGGSGRALKLNGGSGSLALEIVGGGGIGAMRITTEEDSGIMVTCNGGSYGLEVDGASSGASGMYAKSGSAGGHGIIAESGNTARAPAYLKPMASAPSSPLEGMIYPNSTDHKLYFYNGTSWVDLTA